MVNFRSILLFTIAVQCCLLLTVCCGKPLTPADDNLDTAAENALDNESPDGGAIQGSQDSVASEENVKPDDDMMETAENIVFRPLFKYKKQSVEKKRVYRDRNGNLSENPAANPTVPERHGGHPAASGLSPPPLLAYDKKTGSYYPVTSYNPYYNSAYASYRA